MRTCKLCGVQYEPVAYQHDVACRSCRSKKRRKWRERCISEGKPISHVAMPREYHAKYEKAYFANPEKRAQRYKRMCELLAKSPEYRIKVKARRKLRHEVSMGRIQRQPCEVCGAFGQAHHHDYSKPLDVRWLCREHHKEEHQRAERSWQVIHAKVTT